MSATLGWWSLGSTPLLAWGAAALIPLAIHLWSRRRYAETSWAAMQFLLAAMQRHSRRLRLEQWILLAIRMAAILLFSLALADPIWSWTRVPAGAAPRDPTHFVFVVDTSFSMAYQEGDQTWLGRAQDRMRRIVEQSSDGDAFSLLVMQRPPRMVASEVVFERDAFLQQVEQLKIAHTDADLSATLALLRETLDRSRRRYPRLKRQRVQWFTDLGRNTWGNVASGPDRTSLERIVADTECFVEELGAVRRTNMAITGLSSSTPVATPGNATTLTAEVQGFELSKPTTTQVEFLVNGRVVHSQDVELTGGGPTVVTYRHTWDSVGDQVVSARIGRDSLPLDNERWWVQSVRGERSVLCVEGEPDAAKFVSLALRPEPSRRAPIDVVVVGDGELLVRNLQDFDAIFLCNVGQFTEPERDALWKFAASGGGVVVTAGDLVQAAEYNRVLGTGPRAILPGAVGEVKRGEWFFDPLRYRHPLVAPFRGRERAGLLTVPTWRYMAFQPRREAVTALAFGDNSPAVVESRVGRGYCLWVGTALSTSSVDREEAAVTPWSALPAWPSFPPLVHGLLQAAVRGRGEERTVEVGSPLEIALPTTATNSSVLRPDQQREPLTLAEADDQRLHAEYSTSEMGIYRVEWGANEPPVTPASLVFAANGTPSESDLSRISREELPEPLRDDVFDAGNGPRHAAADETQSWFRAPLVAVILLLLLEQLSAVAFARRGA